MIAHNADCLSFCYECSAKSLLKLQTTVSAIPMTVQLFIVNLILVFLYVWILSFVFTRDTRLANHVLILFNVYHYLKFRLFVQFLYCIVLFLWNA